MEKLHRDELVLIGLNLDINDIFNLIKTNKRLNNLFDERFWKIKVNRDYPNFINRQNSYKDQYVLLTKILKKNIFEDILERPSILNNNDMNGYPDIYMNEFLDLYDLLYNQISKSNSGVIKYRENDEISKEFAIIRQLIDFDSYKYNDIGRMRDFLNDTGFHEQMLHHLDWFPGVSKKRFSTLKTFEYRLQTHIINNTSDHVKFEIYLKDNKLKYNDNEIEFLQILHDGIKSRKLSIFDSVDYDLLIKKLKR